MQKADRTFLGKFCSAKTTSMHAKNAAKVAFTLHEKEIGSSNS